MSFAVLVFLTSAGLVAGASPAGAATTVDVEVGYAGRYQQSRDVPVRVRVNSDRLVRGTLVVQGRGGGPAPLEVEVPVELAGGSVSELTVVVPSVGFWGDFVAVVDLHDGDRTVASGRGQASLLVDDELVGLLPGAIAGRELPRPAPLAVDAGVARFATVTDADLAAAPSSLAPLDVLVGTAAAIDELPPDSWAAIRRWVDRGGHLLLDDAASALPPAWRPGPSGRARAGAGEVGIVGDAVARGAWNALIEPTPLSGSSQHFGFSGEPVEMTLARDAGLRFPQLNLVLGFLAFYAVGLVPVSAYLLRRAGRGELAWVVLPVLAVACTGIAYGVGRGIRDDSRTVQASVLETGDVAWLTSAVGVVSRSGGTESVRFPRGWTPASQMSNFGPMGQPASTTAVLGGRGLVTRQRLDAGQFAVRAAHGPVALDGALEVSASTEGDDVVGTVRNTLDIPLDDVAVFHDGRAVRLNRLAPGASSPFRVSPQGNGQPFPGAADRVWPQASGINGRLDRDGVVSMGVWSMFASRLPAGAPDAGSVLAAGWTRRFDGPATTDGDQPPGRTLVVGSGAVTPGPGPLRGAAVETAIVRWPFGGDRPVGPDDPVILRFTLPIGTDGRSAVPPHLVVRGPNTLRYSVWTGAGWEPLGAVPDTAGDQNPFGMGPSQDFALPPGAVVDGRVWLRSQTPNQDPFMLMAAPILLEERA